MSIRLLPLLQVYIPLVTLFLFGIALPRLVSLLGVGRIGLLRGIVFRRLMRVFLMRF